MAPPEKTMNVIVDHFPLSSHADSLFKFYRGSARRFPEFMPRKIQSIELINPSWDSVGSERVWTFCGEKASWNNWTDNVEMQAVVGQERSITFTLLKGEVLQPYNSLKVTHNFSPVDEGCLAEVVVTFDKKDNDSPIPLGVLKFFGELVRAVDGHPSLSA